MGKSVLTSTFKKLDMPMAIGKIMVGSLAVKSVTHPNPPAERLSTSSGDMTIPRRLNDMQTNRGI
jgi:hypothetical protein